MDMRGEHVDRVSAKMIKKMGSPGNKVGDR